MSEENQNRGDMRVDKLSNEYELRGIVSDKRPLDVERISVVALIDFANGAKCGLKSRSKGEKKL